ncbi:ParM/StbA family protein [Bacillus cereus]|uniref:Uncharacterized protein n=1 Tax=Bacillus cereus TaxID=1396 RepID=A0A1C4DU41_BACCE|nr:MULTISPECIES: ParM/StbA family protein [Bacillus cereus group]HDR7784913.1 ParM/StbA family protein [Bacillus wiedmannii]MCU5435824.1 ParM/StbA family protein [Bacillus mobilis]OKA27369.1 hypothetical protein BJR06_30115 [Bacillus cereus]OKA30480.1 hypothetical protein BJR07_29880 [Bacillus cereus]SCC34781.1 Uncharacterized protein BC0861_03627 [Bacillus mobilis]
MLITAAIDAGNDALKALFNGFENKLYIPNVVKEMESRQVIELGDNPLKELHVHITSSALKKSATYAVGTLAAKEKQSAQIPATDLKSDSDQTTILMLTALAYEAASNSDKDVIDAEFLLSTGLPVDEVKEDKRAGFKKKLLDGTHVVEFKKTPHLEGKKVRISFKDIFVNVEGFAAMINLTISEDLKPQNAELRQKNILINDMGGNTTDKAVIRMGQIDNEYSSGSPLGIGEYLDAIRKEVFTTYRVEVFKSRRQLVENMTAKHEAYIIRPHGKPVSYYEIAERHLKEFAVREYADLVDKWKEVGDLHSIHNVGGSAAIVKSFLEDINKNENQFEMHFLDTEESIWSIAKAYYKLLLVIAKQKELSLN